MQLILIDAVNLSGRHHGLDDRHDALAHVPVKRVITAEHFDAVPTQHILDLKVRSAHFHERLGIVAASNDAPVIIAEHDDRGLFQIGTEDALAARIEAVAVDQREDRLKPFQGGAD